jgi:hypothetical protein
VSTLNKTYSLLNRIEKGLRNILITNLKGPLNWMWMVLRGEGKKSTNMDNHRKKVNNEIKEMVAKVAILTLEETTPESKDVGCNTSHSLVVNHHPSVEQNSCIYGVGQGIHSTHIVVGLDRGYIVGWTGDTWLRRGQLCCHTSGLDRGYMAAPPAALLP